MLRNMAGVSVTTVSRVMNNRGAISEDKKKVMKAIEELDYHPNELRVPASKRSTLIGVMFLISTILSLAD